MAIIITQISPGASDRTLRLHVPADDVRRAFLLCEGRSRAMAEMRLFDSEAEAGSIKVIFEASSIVPISSSEQLVVQSLFHPLGARVL